MKKIIIDKKKIVEYFNITVYIVLLFFIMIVGFRTYFPNIYHNYSQHRIFVVVSNSMEPTIKKNSIISVKTNAKEYIEEDIITFKIDIDDDGYVDYVTHRIHSVEDGKYYTYSDNSKQLDNWVVEGKDIVGKVKYSIPYIGIIIPIVSKYAIPVLVSMLILLIMLLLLTWKNWDKI